MSEAGLNGRRVLVTGSEGFVGRHLTRHLGASNRVYRVSRSLGQDLEDPAIVAALPAADYVFHLAALAGVPETVAQPHVVLQRNVAMTANMLEYTRRQNARFVFASSYLYGRPNYLPTDETHPVQITNPYMASKHLSEECCRLYHELYGCDVIVLRFFNIYGAGQRATFLIPEIIDQLRAGRELRLRDPHPKRDFVYIDDALRAYELAAIRCHGFATVNIGSGQAHSVAEIVDLLARLWGRPVRVHYGSEPRLNEIAETRADTRRALELLGWRPAIELAEGLERMLAGERREVG